MFLREKLFVIGLIGLAYILVFYHITPWGNHFWETRIGSTARYAVMQKEKVGYINGRGRLIIPMQYAEGTPFSDKGLILVKSGEKWGYINHDGATIIPFDYSRAKDFSKGLAAVAIKERKKFFPLYGFIDENGKEVISIKYTDAKSFAENGLAAVKEDAHWGYLNTYGNFDVRPIYDEANDFHQERAAVKQNGQWGYIDSTGNMVIEPQFDEVGDFSEGIAPVRQKDLWGYINLQGTWVVKPIYSEAHSLSEGLGLVKGYNAVGFVDKSGQVIYRESNWIDAKDFSNGVAAVKVAGKQNNPYTGKWGYITTSGRFLIVPQFDWASGFNGGLARVGLDKNDIRRGYVNKSARMMWDPADWQQSASIRSKIFIVIVLGILVYLFNLIRYIKWNKQLKKDEAIKRATAVSKSPRINPY